ncbi:LLM class flavin-dependent oxidoreductase [Capillimicrobium parvum]|uniref:Alkanesulfonate monooxygenase n=1 Tax=Capillimicrobium parvum TaxID=2884022 RepID=A0A9E6XZ85_9ACTN|nr:LLM class flavin-dependent oxidoreductase [Capillimicrobium parvum]UGS36682.1 Alkanesulfonate monooxygenase [Capillimicrobium parvum]
MKIRFAVAPGSGPLDGEELARFGDAVETSGFDGIWLSDLPLAPVLDPLLGLAVLAGRTRRCHLGANVVPLGRNPFLLAKELAQLDRLTGGRLLLSFVPGLGSPEERETLGVEGADRGAILEEALGLVRAWWAGDVVDHRSPRWSFSTVAAAARPVQDPLEVWLGGRAGTSLDRAGRIADGWLGSTLTPDEAERARRRIQRAASRAERRFDPEHFGLSIGYARADPDPSALARLRVLRDDLDPRELLPVGAQELRSSIERHIDAGLSKFVLRPTDAVASWDEEVAWLAAAILDLQT